MISAAADRARGFFYWTSKEYLDLEAVLNWGGRKYKKTGLIGFLGAATGIISVARKHKADSLIAVSAPTEFKKIDYLFWNLDVENEIIYDLGEGRKGKGLCSGPFAQKRQAD